MDINQTYNEIIDHSIKNSSVPVREHLIEEIAELTIELCNEKRNREAKTLSEMADVLFQMSKYLKAWNLDLDHLKELSIAKSCVKYPEFMETLS